MTENEADQLARLVDQLAPEVLRADDPANALAAWTMIFKRRLVKIAAKDARARERKRFPRIPKGALRALEAVFNAADAGGFQGDQLDTLTHRQTTAAERWIQETWRAYDS